MIIHLLFSYLNNSLTIKCSKYESVLKIEYWLRKKKSFFMFCKRKSEYKSKINYCNFFPNCKQNHTQNCGSWFNSLNQDYFIH